MRVRVSFEHQAIRLSLSSGMYALADDRVKLRTRASCNTMHPVRVGIPLGYHGCTISRAILLTRVPLLVSGLLGSYCDS